MGAKLYMNTPVGPLEWVYVTGKGKKDKRSTTGRHLFTAQVVLDPENKPAHKKFIESVKEFWKDNKPSGIRKPKSLGLYDHQVPHPDGAKDEDGCLIYVKTGKTVVLLSTDTTYKDGNKKKITIRNKSGGEIQLGDKRIGNGSRGRLGGCMYIYENGGEAGVTMYLEELQLTKFVEFKRAMSAVEDDEVDEDEDDGMDVLTGGVVSSEDSSDDSSDDSSGDSSDKEAAKEAAKALADNISGL